MCSRHILVLLLEWRNLSSASQGAVVLLQVTEREVVEHCEFYGIRASVVGGKRPIFWVSLGENTVTVAVFVVFTYYENKQFLRCFLT